MVAENPNFCKAVAFASGDNTYSLNFELYNQGDTSIELATYEPFTDFSVLATANGKPIMVHEPALDIPVNSTTIRIPPNGTVTIETPIRLQIFKGAEPGDDGFVWTIAHEKETLSLQIKLNLSMPFDVLCPVLFQ